MTKHILLLLARDFAEHAATPVFLVDSEGTLVFFNEPAGEILGRRFSEVGELSAQEWGTNWQPEDIATGEPLPVEQLPLSIAFMQHKPAFKAFQITAPDGSRRNIEVVAFPLLGDGDSFVGAAAIFWQQNQE